MSDINCPLCGASALLVFAEHPGFRAPARYDLYECDQCSSSFVQPLAVDAALYELIYAKAAQVPGYERYVRYRREIASAAEPLAALAEREDVYWAIRECLRGIERERRQGKPLRILEIGSGFGYLTYALRAAGYVCEGIDLSREAVATAIATFGPYYRAVALEELAVEQARYDVVIATELIEHLPAPLALLEKARALLAPSGTLIVTTPNRDVFSRRTVWDTDLPPVHLWWFSPTSLRFMAWQLGMDVGFVDFSRFYGRTEQAQRSSRKQTTFDADGNVLAAGTWLSARAERALRKAPRVTTSVIKALLTLLALDRTNEALFRDSLSLCATFRPRALPCIAQRERTPIYVEGVDA